MRRVFAFYFIGFSSADLTDFLIANRKTVTQPNDTEVKEMVKSLLHFALNNEDPYDWLDKVSRWRRNKRFL